MLTEDVNSCCFAKHHFVLRAAVLSFQITSTGLERTHNSEVLSEWEERFILSSWEAKTLPLQC